MFPSTSDYNNPKNIFFSRPASSSPSFPLLFPLPHLSSSCLPFCLHPSAPFSSHPSLTPTSHLLFSSLPLFLILSSSPLRSLMETSFMADSKCVCGVAHSSVREISAERITLAFSTNAVLWLTFDGEISHGCKFNHSDSVCMCVCVCVFVPDHSLLECQQWPLISWLVGRQKLFPL